MNGLHQGNARTVRPPVQEEEPQRLAPPRPQTDHLADPLTDSLSDPLQLDEQPSGAVQLDEAVQLDGDGPELARSLTMPREVSSEVEPSSVDDDVERSGDEGDARVGVLKVQRDHASKEVEIGRTWRAELVEIRDEAREALPGWAANAETWEQTPAFEAWRQQNMGLLIGDPGLLVERADSALGVSESSAAAIASAYELGLSISGDAERIRGLEERCEPGIAQIYDHNLKVLIQRDFAKRILEEGTTRFGGGGPLGIVEDLTQTREEEGRGDEPLSLHADDGPGMAMGLLRSAMKEYVLATRAKEELRSELGVNNLKKVSRSTLRENPELKGRIAEVRERKDAAEKRFKRVRKTVQGYLAEGITDTLAMQIQQIDQQVLGLDTEQTQAHVDTARGDRAEKGERAARLARVTDKMVLGEAEFGRLRRSIAPLAEAGVGSRDFDISVGVSFKLGVGSGSSVTIGGGIKYGGTTNIGDDRKLRVGHSWTFSGKGKAELAAVASGSAAAALVRGSTEVFKDADHWAAVMAYRFQDFKRQIHSHSDEIEETVEENFSVEESEELLATVGLAEDTTKVKSTTLSGTLAAGLLGTEISGSKARSWMTFTKGEGDEQQTLEAEQVVKTFTASPASNVTLAATRTVITGHANPDNDGRYWNIKLTFGGKAAAKFTAYTEEAPDAIYGGWEQSLRRALGVEAQPSADGESAMFAEEELVSGISEATDEGNPGQVVSAISDYLGADIASLEGALPSDFDLELALATTKSQSVEWNWVTGDDGKNLLQYRRISRAKGISGSVEAPVGTVGLASASLALGGGKSEWEQVSETLGADTLSYLQTVFNGLHAADVRDQSQGRDGPDRWGEYASGHEAEIWAALCNLGAREGGAWGELQGAMDATLEAPSGIELDDWAPVAAKGHEARIAARGVAADTAGLSTDDKVEIDPGKLSSGLAALTRYMEKQGAFDAAARELDWS